MAQDRRTNHTKIGGALYTSMEIQLSARGFANDFEFEGATVINAGNWFGNTYLINANGSQFIVEASDDYDAIEQFAGSKYGCMILVDDETVEEYTKEGWMDDLTYTESGYVDIANYFTMHKTQECVYQIEANKYYQMSW